MLVMAYMCMSTGAIAGGRHGTARRGWRDAFGDLLLLLGPQAAGDEEDGGRGEYEKDQDPRRRSR